MYQAGMAKEKSDAMAAAGIMEGTCNAVDFDGDNWEEEAEQLLEWTADLDYDTYFREWSTVGTSGNVYLGGGDLLFWFSSSFYHCFPSSSVYVNVNVNITLNRSFILPIH